jgi:hypothetical protein
MRFVVSVVPKKEGRRKEINSAEEERLSIRRQLLSGADKITNSKHAIWHQ